MHAPISAVIGDADRRFGVNSELGKKAIVSSGALVWMGSVVAVRAINAIVHVLCVPLLASKCRTTQKPPDYTPKVAATRMKTCVEGYSITLTEMALNSGTKVCGYFHRIVLRFYLTLHALKYKYILLCQSFQSHELTQVKSPMGRVGGLLILPILLCSALPSIATHSAHLYATTLTNLPADFATSNCLISSHLGDAFKHTSAYTSNTLFSANPSRLRHSLTAPHPLHIPCHQHSTVAHFRTFNTINDTTTFPIPHSSCLTGHRATRSIPPVHS
ncbi:unnamed protein product [Hydatigera taeniaeformis]|uniref:Transmembrane protein n=1 Tax=Hydatigena taeniaeformis TaxID=6205 RepID=A0A0R3XAS1_HYDTA|nr:unnamed protein product [Hydatigera taeniaeformis]